MSRFTTSILLATLLLGILLWIVVSMAVDFANAPEEPLTLETPVEYDPALPRIHTRAELAAYLSSNGLDGRRMLNGFEGWLKERGYPGDILEQRGAEDELVAEASDTELLMLAGTGDMASLHELAERSLRDGRPLEAIEWYDQAVANGSLYAMARRAELIDTLSDPALAGFATGGEWPPELQRITQDRKAGLRDALGWTLATLMVGGYAVMDTAQANRLTEFLADMDSIDTRLGCEAAQNFVLEAASSRRARGGAVFSTDSPLFAVTVAEPATLDPCPVPIVPLVSMEHCEYFNFVDPVPNRLMSAWVCPY